MFEPMVKKLCEDNGKDYDEILKTLSIDSDEFRRPPSAQRIAQLAEIFGMSVTDIVEQCKENGAEANTANEYTVCFLFDKSLNHVLLQRKIKTEFAGLWNGVGGSCKNGETHKECALREIREETGVKADEIENLVYLGTLTLPYDCKTMTHTDCILHYYAGIVDENAPQPQPNEPELLEWHNTNYVRSMSITSAEKFFAGNGDLQFFVHIGVKEQLEYRKQQKGQS